MGTSIELAGGKLDVNDCGLDSLDVFELMYPATNTKVPIREIAKYEGGKLFEEFADIKVSAAFAGIDNKLQLLPAEAAADLRQVSATNAAKPGHYGNNGSYTHLFIVRRLKHVYNSSCHNSPGNPAFLHPGDRQTLGYNDSEVARLASEYGAVDVIIMPDVSLRPGVVSMSHCFGGDPQQSADIAQSGSAAASLISVDKNYDPLMGMRTMSAFAVKFIAVEGSA